jgi:hypothetical protein
MVMPIKDLKLDAAAGAGAVGGRRPTAVPAPAAAAPELSDRPRRRTFTVGDKLRVLAEIDRAPAGGKKTSRVRRSADKRPPNRGRVSGAILLRRGGAAGPCPHRHRN